MGREAPAGALLRIADIILTSFTALSEIDESFSDSRRRPQFEALDVDIAMKNAWMVVEFQRAREWDIDSINPYTKGELRRKIEKYLGPDWLQLGFMSPSESLYGPSKKVGDLSKCSAQSGGAYEFTE